VAIPIVSHYTFETLLLAFVLLLAGNMFRGLESRLDRDSGKTRRTNPSERGVQQAHSR